MCQMSEGERNYLTAVDRSTRKRGYDAFKAGEPITAALAEADHPLKQYSDRRQFEMGWRTAEAGRDPW